MTNGLTNGYENPQRQKALVLPGEPGPSSPKRNIYAQKVMLCIWWNQKGMVYHELLKPGETITAVSYKQKLMTLIQALKKKKPAVVRQTS